MLPASLPSRETCYRHYRQWHSSGLLHKVMAALYHDLLTRGAFDLQQALSTGRVEIRRLGNRYKWAADPALQSTWQLKTAVLYYQLAIQRVRRKAL